MSAIHPFFKATWQMKAAARKKVRKALESGRLTKPHHCEHCWDEPRDTNNIHAHHEDYSKPLDVMWLCATCHQIRHSVINKWEGRRERFHLFSEWDQAVEQ